MRTSRYQIQGINRYTNSPENDSPFCSELINIKYSDGLKVTGTKRVVSANIPYILVKIHRANNKVNYIGVKDDAEGVSIVHFDPSTGDIIQTIAPFAAGSEIYFEFLNQMIVISDKTAIKMYVYIFNETYKKFYDGLDITIEHSVSFKQYEDSEAVYDGEVLIPNGDYYARASIESKDVFFADLIAYFNKFKTDNKFYEGNFLYAINATLWDGNETAPFFIAHSCTPLPTGDDSITQSNKVFKYEDFYDRDNFMLRLEFVGRNNLYKPTIVTGNNPNILQYKEIIKSFNLYTSRGTSWLKFDNDNLITKDISWGTRFYPNDSQISFVEQIPEKVNLERDLLYKQKSWTLEEFSQGVSYEYDLGLDKITTGETMEVSASMLERAGQMYAYNNRLHFFNSKVRIKDFDISKILYKDIQDEGYADYSCPVWVYLRIDGENKIIKYENVTLRATVSSDYEGYTIALPDMIIYPDSRAYRIVTGIWSAEYGEYLAADITLSSSPAYNYAYAFTQGKVEANGDGTQFTEDDSAIYDNTYLERRAINVTANSNPIVFPVEHSYLFNGNIDSICVTAIPVSEMQVGQFPIYVFTDNGIYALAQGSGAILYSNILPVNADRCDNSQAIYTRSGVIYISNNGVYLLAGINSKKISMLLEGEIDTYIQNNEHFLKCCANSFYNIEPYLSKVNFRDYVKDAKLIYNINLEEIIVSNPSYPYSYIYSFIHNSWHKQSGVFSNVDNELVLRPVLINSQSATPAQGEITLQAMTPEKEKTFSYVCVATYDTAVSCGAAEKIALIIDGKQVASSSFAQITQMNLIMSSLCNKIGYLEDYKGSLYSNINLDGKVTEVYNITTGTTMTMFTFSASSGTVSIPNKVIGANIQITINGTPFQHTFQEYDSVVTMLNSLVDKINNYENKVVQASVYMNKIILISTLEGTSGNSTTIAVTSNDNDYIYLNTSNTTLSGGEDISLKPSEYNEIIAWDDEELGQKQTIHLHTRPLCLENPNGYKTIKRCMLNTLAELSGEDNLSVYIYASNNLVDWKCVAAAQRQNCKISQISTDRINKAYKYFVFMIGGVVSNLTQLQSIVLSVEDVTHNKLR